MGFFSSFVSFASGGLISSGSKTQVSTASISANATNFASSDKDGNGYLSTAEFNSFLNTNIKLGSDKIAKNFSDADSDKDGQLSREEFLALDNKKVVVGVVKSNNMVSDSLNMIDPTGMTSSLFGNLF